MWYGAVSLKSRIRWFEEGGLTQIGLGPWSLQEAWASYEYVDGLDPAVSYFNPSWSQLRSLTQEL